MDKLMLWLGVSLCSALAAAKPVVSTDGDRLEPHIVIEEFSFKTYPSMETLGLPSNGVNQEIFEALKAKIQKTYVELFAAQGIIFEVQGDWSSKNIRAYAGRYDKDWFINVSGGFARRPEVSKDGVLLMMCHEIGHHLGGAPKHLFLDYTWASNEGQSDYWAATKCAKRVFANDDNLGVISRVQIPEVVAAQCEKVYGVDNNSYALCVRTALAAKTLTDFYVAGNTRLAVPRFETPDRALVPWTQPKHPQPQCRLDTYFHGALCHRPDQDMSDSDAHAGACSRFKGDVLGVRPRCWFHPTDHG